jgi:hypothetical protein
MTGPVDWESWLRNEESHERAQRRRDEAAEGNGEFQYVWTPENPTSPIHDPKIPCN